MKRLLRVLRFTLWTVFILGVLVLAIPQESDLFRRVGIDIGSLKVRRGLDLQGGIYLVYEANVTGVPEADVAEALANTTRVIERRVNPGGVSEVVVQTAEGNRIVVQIPGISSSEQAKALIGRTAQLVFTEVQVTEVGGQSLPEFLPTEIGGKDVDEAAVDFHPTTGEVVVNVGLKGGDSTAHFADLTRRIFADNRMLLIELDNQPIFGPARVQQPITDGQVVLSGGFSAEQAQEVATLINAGALPLPVELVAERNIGPTLGAESVKMSVLAGIIGLGSVSLFLILYYRLAGFLAVLSLIFYTALTLVIYKFSAFTPYAVVLTLGGIAGFILSIAMAADANILIIERMREEVRSRNTVKRATVLGYQHAWTSIKDASMATIIGSVILYYFGTPIIRGFAITLGLGVLISLLVVILISKRLLLLVTKVDRLSKSTRWLRVSEENKG